MGVSTWTDHLHHAVSTPYLLMDAQHVSSKRQRIGSWQKRKALLKLVLGSKEYLTLASPALTAHQ